MTVSLTFKPPPLPIPSSLPSNIPSSFPPPSPSPMGVSPSRTPPPLVPHPYLSNALVPAGTYLPVRTPSSTSSSDSEYCPPPLPHQRPNLRRIYSYDPHLRDPRNHRVHPSPAARYARDVLPHLAGGAGGMRGGGNGVGVVGGSRYDYEPSPVMPTVPPPPHPRQEERPYRMKPKFTQDEMDTFPAANFGSGSGQNNHSGFGAGGPDPWLDCCTCRGDCSCRSGTRRGWRIRTSDGGKLEGMIREADFTGGKTCDGKEERERRRKRKEEKKKAKESKKKEKKEEEWKKEVIDALKGMKPDVGGKEEGMMDPEEMLAGMNMGAEEDMRHAYEKLAGQGRRRRPPGGMGMMDSRYRRGRRRPSLGSDMGMDDQMGMGMDPRMMGNMGRGMRGRGPRGGGFGGEEDGYDEDMMDVHMGMGMGMGGRGRRGPGGRGRGGRGRDMFEGEEEPFMTGGRDGGGPGEFGPRGGRHGGDFDDEGEFEGFGSPGFGGRNRRNIGGRGGRGMGGRGAMPGRFDGGELF